MCVPKRHRHRQHRLPRIIIAIAIVVVIATIMAYSRPFSAAARSSIARKPVPDDPMQPVATPSLDVDYMSSVQPPRPRSRKDADPGFYQHNRSQQPAGPRHMKSISEYKDYCYDDSPRSDDTVSSRAYQVPHASPSPSRLSLKPSLVQSSSFTDDSDEDDDDFPPPPPPPAHRSTLSLATTTTMSTPSPSHSSSIYPPIALPPSKSRSTTATIPDDDTGTVRRLGPRPQSRLDLDTHQPQPTHTPNRDRSSPSPSRPMLHRDWKTKMEEQYEWKNPPSVFLKNHPQRAQTFHAFAQNKQGRPSTAQAAYNPQSFFLARSESSPLHAPPRPDSTTTPGYSSGSTANTGLGTFVPVEAPSDIDGSSISSISSVLPTIPPGPGPSRGRPQSRAQSRLSGTGTPRPASPRKQLPRSNLSVYSSSPPKASTPIEQCSNDLRPSTRSGTALSNRAGSSLSYATTRRSLYSSSSPLLPTPPIDNDPPRTGTREKAKKKTVTEPIIESDGTVTDPSDYLPPDTWAPEPDHMEDELAARTPSDDKENYETRTGRASAAGGSKIKPPQYDARASSRLSRSMSPTKTRRPIARPPSAAPSIWADNQDYPGRPPRNMNYGGTSSSMSSRVDHPPLPPPSRQDSHFDLDFHNTLSPAKTRASPVPPRTRSPTRPQTTRSGVNIDFYAPPTGPPLPKSVPIQPGLGCEVGGGGSGRSNGNALSSAAPPPPPSSSYSSSSSSSSSSAFAPFKKPGLYEQYDYYPYRPSSTMRAPNNRPMTATPMDALSYGMRRMELSDVTGRG